MSEEYRPLSLSDRFFWFRHNLFRLPFALIWCVLYSIYGLFAILYVAFFVTNGSQTLSWPWE